GFGVARTKVLLLETGMAPRETPEAAIKNGGFSFAFDGDPNHSFQVRVVYEDNHCDNRTCLIDIPRFQITARNPLTGHVVTAITGFAPPRGTPLHVRSINGDRDRPQLLTGPQRFNNFDPGGELTFTFSKAMKKAS